MVMLEVTVNWFVVFGNMPRDEYNKVLVSLSDAKSSPFEAGCVHRIQNKILLKVPATVKMGSLFRQLSGRLKVDPARFKCFAVTPLNLKLKSLQRLDNDSSVSDALKKCANPPILVLYVIQDPPVVFPCWHPYPMKIPAKQRKKKEKISKEKPLRERSNSCPCALTVDEAERH